MKTWTKRKLTYYGNPQVEIVISVYTAEGELTSDELKAAADSLADAGMLSMRDAKYIHAPLSRIEVR